MLAVVGTGAALAALIMAQSAAHRREIGDLRKEMHQELGGIRIGMQLPHPAPAEEPGTGS